MQSYIAFCIMNHKGKFLSHLFVDDLKKDGFRATRLAPQDCYWYDVGQVACDIAAKIGAVALPIYMDNQKTHAILLPHNASF